MNLKVSQNMPGSVVWRLINYGAISTLKYILFEKAFKRKKPDFKSFDTSSVAVTKFLNLDQNKFDFISNFVDKYLADCETILLNNDIEIKIGTVGKDSPKNRLYAIGLAVIAFKPNTYIETGTQHGVSAGFVEKLSEALEIEIKVVSFDLDEKSNVIPGFSFERVLLKNPVRKSLVKSLYDLKLEHNKIIFFHDSDHSFENMYSEFKIAQKVLDPVAIISDDISLNKSFLKFCNREKFKFMQFRISSGNAAGIAFKNTRDPDGT